MPATPDARGNGYPADTASQRIVVQRCEKETAARLKKYFDAPYAVQTPGQGEGPSGSSGGEQSEGVSRQAAVMRRRILSGVPKPPEWMAELKTDREDVGHQSHHRRIHQYEPHYPPMTTDPTALDMLPPSPTTRALLYRGISRDNQGRAAYLRERSQLDPEVKYRVPPVSSAEYGWALGEFGLTGCVKGAGYGRSRQLQKELYTRNGVDSLPLPPLR